MIPSPDILELMDFPAPVPEITDGRIEYVIQYVAGQIDAWSDPCFLLKKKCPPTVPPASIHTISTQKRYVCILFPNSKIGSVSFEKSQMSNLIVDGKGRLLQLLFETENRDKLKPGYEYIETIEYHSSVGIFLARKLA